MNPEFLSDGLLYESKDEWQKAFLEAPERTALLLAKEERAFADDCKAFCDRFDSFDQAALLSSCIGAIDDFLDALPKRTSLFPSEAERRALLPAVLALFSRMEGLSAELWKALEALSASQKTLGELTDRGERLNARLFPAAAASVGLSLSPDPSIALSDCLQSMEALLKRSEAVHARANMLDRLSSAFFRDFSSELAQAADLEHDGASSSPATLFRLAGNAKQTLSLIASEIPAAFRF